MSNETPQSIKRLAFKVWAVCFSLMLNLWFLLYFWVLQPPLLKRLSQIPEQPDVALGVLLLLVIVVETLGMWLKYPGLMTRFREGGKLSALGAFVTSVTVMGHMGFMTGLLSFRVIAAFGVDLRGSSSLILGLLAVLFLMAMLTKEVILLTFAMDVLKQYHTFDDTLIPNVFKHLHGHFPSFSQMMAEIMLAIFSAVAYTATWDIIVTESPLTAETLGGQLWEYAGALLLFCMIFPATHPLLTIEIWLTDQPLKARISSIASFFFTMVLAILSIQRV